MEQRLYKLSEGWKWSLLSEITVKTSNFSPSQLPKTQFTYIDISSIDRNSNKIVNPKEILGAEAPSRAKKDIKPMDILFATTRPNLKNIAIYSGGLEPSVASTGFCIFRPKNNVNERFLFYFLISDLLQKQIAPFISGAQYPAITDKKLKRSQIPLPPLSEQKRIINKLNALFTRIDTAINHIQDNLKLSKDFFASVLDAAFVPTGNMDHPPTDWSCESLQAVSTRITDGTHHSPKEQFDSKQDGLFKYITSKNVKFNGLKLDNITYIRKELHEPIYARCNPEHLDQLITKDGAKTGTCCLNTIDEPFSLLSSVALVKLKRDIMSPYFLNYFLQSPTGQELMLGDISGAAITRTNLKKLKALKVPLPPMKEQQGIITHLNSLAKRTHAIEAAMEEKLHDLAALKSSLLDNAFRGQL